MTLDLTLDPTESDPLFLQIAARLSSAIATGHVSPGARLPSARALAAQLAVARGTVDAAYAMLAGEGAIVPRGPAGTIVSGPAGGRTSRSEHTPFMFDGRRRPPNAEAPLPFRMGLPALDAFPRKLWSSLTVQAARRAQAGRPGRGRPRRAAGRCARPSLPISGVARGIAVRPARCW